VLKGKPFDGESGHEKGGVKGTAQRIYAERRPATEKRR
jgi:hypothetical protein